MEQPEVEHRHHHTGRPWWDLALGVSAILISMISIFLAVHNGRAMERLVQANSWPFVVITHSRFNQDGSPHNHLDIANKGVGPARIESLEAFYEGKPVNGPRALLDAILSGAATKSSGRILESTVVHNVLAAKEQVTIADFHSEDFSPEDYKTIGTEIQKTQFRVCYCSVFEECWVRNTNDAPPVHVEACPVPAEPYQ
jgi:hypothetical protein